MQNKLDIDSLAKDFMLRCKSLPSISVAVTFPTSEDSLVGAIESAHLGLIKPILIGPKKQMQSIAEKHDLDITSFEIINIEDSEEAAEKSVALVREGKADTIMKGNLHTDDLMRKVIKKDTGLRTKRRISHAFIMAIDQYPKPFIITDAAINIHPDLMTKRDIIQNAVDLVNALRKSVVPPVLPKVAILSAVETINPEIPSTIDAACLCKMAERGQIVNAIVDGPFAYDNVISLQAAETKHIKSPVIGDADIFVVPNLEAGNMLAKQLMIMTNALSAGIILGASVPIILTSRSEGVRSRISSCAVAVMMAHAARNKMLEAKI